MSERSARQTLLDRLSATNADDRAMRLEFRGRKATPHELLRLGRSYADRLVTAGVGAGDRVLVCCGLGPVHVVSLIGHHLVGAIHVPVNPGYGARELTHIIEDSQPKLVLADEERALRFAQMQLPSGPERWLSEVLLEDSVFASDETSAESPSTPSGWLRPERQRTAQDVHVAQLDDDAPALMIYTSGTTGKSKGVVLSYGAIVAGIGALCRGWGFNPDDRLALALPLFHVHGLGIGIYGCWLNGSTIDLLPSFSPSAVIEAFEERRATVFMGVPTMYTRLIRWLDEQSSASRAEAIGQLAQARLFTSGSAPLANNDFTRFESLTGHRILERYGMSETLLSVSNPLDGARVAGSVGFAVEGYELRVLDEHHKPCVPGQPGELWVRGPALMSGYWRAPEATAAAFESDWFRTGDVVTMDNEGRVCILGRSSADIIKSGGYKISAREIEDAVLEHPSLGKAIDEVAVFGSSDDYWGQIVCVALCPTSAAQTLSAQDWLAKISSELDGELAAHKRPRLVMICDALPRNALGKLQKHRLRAIVDDPGQQHARLNIARR